MQKLRLLFHKIVVLLLNILDINLDISDLMILKLQQLPKQQVLQKIVQLQIK